MKREQVYKAIDTERKYQDTVRRNNEGETRDDNEKCISDFLLYIEHVLNNAKNDIYLLREDDALHGIRKIAGLCVACGESHGMPERE